MEALDPKSKSPTKVSGKPTKKTKKGLKSYGIGSPGPAGVKEVSPGEATQSQILYGTHIKDLPSGTDFDQQATWGYYKNVVTKMIDGITYGTLTRMADSLVDTAKKASGVANPNVGQIVQGIGGVAKAFYKNPVADKYGDFIAFQAKQKIKTMLAQNYLGKPTDLSKEPIEGVSRDVADLITTAAFTVNDVIQKGVFGDDPANFKKFSGNNRFGKIGTLVAAKMPKLAAMGIDPLDFATKTFGADDALAAYTEIPEKVRSSGFGAGGYLTKGMKQGIY